LGKTSEFPAQMLLLSYNRSYSGRKQFVRDE